MGAIYFNGESYGNSDGSGIIEEVLFFNENETMNLTFVDLPGHIKKYDYIYMEGWHWWDGHKSRESGLYKVSDLQIGDRLGIFCNGLHCWFQLDSWTRLNVVARSHDYCIYTMIGIMLKEREVKTKILLGNWLSLRSRIVLPYKIQANYEVGAEFFIDEMTYRGDSAIIGNTLNHNYIHFNPSPNDQNDSAISIGAEQVSVRLDTVGEHTIIFNKNGGDGNYYDGNKITDYTPTSVDGNLVIGQRAEDSNWNNLFTGRIGNIYIKDTDTDELVCDLKPAKRHQFIGEFEAIDYGIYDIINDEFYATDCLVKGISSACIEDLSLNHDSNYGNVAICDSNYNTYGVAFYDNARPLAPSRAFDGDLYSVWSNNDTGYANAFIAYLHYDDTDKKIPTFDTFEIGQTSILTDRPMQNVTYTLWYGTDYTVNPNRNSDWTKIADITMTMGVNSVKFEPISNATRIMVTVSNNNIGWSQFIAINHIQLYNSEKEI